MARAHALRLGQSTGGGGTGSRNPSNAYPDCPAYHTGAQPPRMLDATSLPVDTPVTITVAPRGTSASVAAAVLGLARSFSVLAETT